MRLDKGGNEKLLYIYLHGLEGFAPVGIAHSKEIMEKAKADLIASGVDENDLYVKSYYSTEDEMEHFQFYIRAGMDKPVHTSIINAAGRGCTRKDDS